MLLVVTTLLLSTLVLASVWPEETKIIEIIPEEKEKVWIPTEEDIAYQDSMFSIIKQTQEDVDTIKLEISRILYKLDRLEYPDGSWDSIRYVKGGKIDQRRN
jgi:hypothetical protein